MKQNINPFLLFLVFIILFSIATMLFGPVQTCPENSVEIKGFYSGKHVFLCSTNR